jgi:hypothetical protein
VRRPGELRRLLPRTPRQLALTAWGVALAVFCLTRGVPLDRWTQTIWLLLALFAANVGRPWPAKLRIVVDWLPFVAFLYLYDLTRGIADKLGRPIHVTEPLNAEKWLFHGVVPTQWLQEHFATPGHLHWYDVVVSVVYVSHFFVVWVFAAVLYLRSRDRWAAWARRILLLSYAGLLTYVLYPAAPPWYASAHGLLPGVHRIAINGWDALHLHFAATLVSRAQGQVNDVAALPSLHAAFTALLTVFVWPVLGRLGRTLMVIYTAAMAMSLVYGGEHYVFDALLGYVYVAAVVLAAGWWERRRARGKPAPAGEPAAAAAPAEALVAGDGQGEDALHG